MANKRIFVFLILGFLSLLSLRAVAQRQDTVVLNDEQEQYPLGLHLEILEDKEKQ